MYLPQILQSTQNRFLGLPESIQIVYTSQVNPCTKVHMILSYVQGVFSVMRYVPDMRYEHTHICFIL